MENLKLGNKMIEKGRQAYYKRKEKLRLLEEEKLKNDVEYQNDIKVSQNENK